MTIRPIRAVGQAFQPDAPACQARKPDLRLCQARKPDLRLCQAGKPDLRQPRRGVLLLVVLGLLAMFGLVSIAFVMISGQSRRVSEVTRRIEQYREDPKDLLDEAAMVVVTGSKDPACPIAGDSLLEDLYGGDSVQGWFANVGPVVATMQAGQPQFLEVAPPPVLSRPEILRRVGCVLTVAVPGSVSTRIVAYNSAKNRYHVMAFDGQRVVPNAASPTGYDVYVGDTLLSPTTAYVINGLPFSGTGVGFNAVNNKFDAADTDGISHALRPNMSAPSASGDRDAANYRSVAGNGFKDLANEDYDAPDAQNMALALVVTDATWKTSVPIPSYHRPELIRYWYNQLVADSESVLGSGYKWPNGFSNDQKWQAILQPSNPAYTGTLPAGMTARLVWFKRKISLRPLTEDNPNFNGSNPTSWPPGLPASPALQDCWEIGGGWGGLKYRWDVDTDGDGVPDSNWIDIGSPVRSTADGRLYKALFAYHIVDMDGRANLNAHGNRTELAAEYGQQAIGPYAGGNGADPLNLTLATLPRGDGYGPAEIRLSRVVPQAEMAQLLNGAGAVEGRYGEILVRLGGSETHAGQTGTLDRLTQIKHFERTNDFTQLPLCSFGTPSDLWGRGRLALDHIGQPFYQRINGGDLLWWTNEIQNNPYCLNLNRNLARPSVSQGTMTDNPFTVHELERALRPYDVDSGILAKRLVQLAPSVVNLRHEVTTDSYDLPVPGGSTGTTAVGPGRPRVRTIAEMLRERIDREKGWTEPLSAAQEQEMSSLLAQLPAWDLLANQRMDVNRPLGNGRDDNGNGVVDEPVEALVEAGWNNVFPNQPSGTIPAVPFQLTNGLQVPDLNWDGKCDYDANADGQADVDINGDGKVNAADHALLMRHYQLLARQLYARHLYMLMMLLLDEGYIQPVTPGTGDDALTADTNQPPGPANQKRELTIRRIAQWAVNVVDFRDADATMTPFEYDINPFNGWDVDGILGSTDDSHAERRLVWGCEAPELLITETLAFHDRRVADTAWDPSKKKRDDDGDGKEDDKDLDQTRVPQGSTFIELYCPRNPNSPIAPGDLYTFDPNTKMWYLDVSRLAPAGTGNLRYPVWRMAVSKPGRRAGVVDPRNNLAARLDNRPDSSSLEPEQFDGEATQQKFSLLGTSPDGVENIEIDRLVWLAPQAPTQGSGNNPHHLDWNRIYYSRGGAARLAPGQYALVGPRATTALGSLVASPPADPYGKPSPQQITLGPPGIASAGRAYPKVFNGSQGAIQPVVPIICAADPPQSWKNAAQTAPTGIGLNISEPLVYENDQGQASNYYPEPTAQNPSTNVMDAYGDLATTDPALGDFLDKPLDSQNKAPLHDDGMLRTATYPDYRTVFLQRLADPSVPYDPTTNPYLTTDWMPVDLTVFNGEDRRPTPPPLGKLWDPDDDNSDADDVVLRGRQRGKLADGSLARVGVWEPALPNRNGDMSKDLGQKTDDPSFTTVNFRHRLYCTLGYVNEWYGEAWSTSDTPAAPPAYVGAPTQRDGSGNFQKTLQWPWLTWNNRPFVSPLELMLVPSSPPARLTWELTVGNATLNPYDAETPPLAKPFGGVAVDRKSPFGPFGQLPNFFHSNDTTVTPPPTPPASPNLYRVFEYLGVPSPFIGTETVLNPLVFGNALPDTLLHRPPFNTVSTYREPGRINLNTIASERVWNALMDGQPGPTFADFLTSRGGYLATGPNWWELAPASKPTLYGNPFRTASSADKRPTVPGVVPMKRAVNATVFRAEGEDPDSTNKPLFMKNVPTVEAADSQKNPYFAYHTLERLGNLTTTRSNVYAVWVTVGYFEVEPVANMGPIYESRYSLSPVQAQTWVQTINPYHPDGFMLGQELGWDTGDVKRHRAFYVIDRSIPVGFERGKDLNAQKTILLKRFIE